MIIPAGFGQANFHFSGAGFTRGAQVALGFQDDGVATAPLTLATLFVANWEANLLPLQTTQITFEKVVVKMGPNLTGAMAEAASGTPGGEATAVLPPNIAGLVSKLTAFGGRKGRGRMYFPGLTEPAVGIDGTYDPTILAAFQAGLDDFLVQAAADGVPLRLLHGDATAPYEITGLQAQSKVATQRRRLRKVG